MLIYPITFYCLLFGCISFVSINLWSIVGEESDIKKFQNKFIEKILEVVYPFSVLGFIITFIFSFCFNLYKLIS